MSQSRAIFLLLILAPLAGISQTPFPRPAVTNFSQDPLFTLMLSQPRIDLESEVPPVAAFDPPTVRPGEQSIYRVTFQGMEQTINWPGTLTIPKELQSEPGAHGQMLQLAGGAFVPVTCFNTRVRAGTPGKLTIPSFEVTIYGKKLTVPSAILQVQADTPEPAHPALLIDQEKTNIYVGQPLTVRVRLPAMLNGGIQGLQQFQITGRGLLLDQGAIRQSISPYPVMGRQVPAMTYEATVTPLTSGEISYFAQGFTLPQQMLMPLTINPGQVPHPSLRAILLESPVLRLTARELPREGKLPGFTGAIGKVSLASATIETNVVNVGDTVKLTASFNCDNDVLRLVPPDAPRIRDWQIFPASTNSPNTQARQFNRAISFGFTLVPLTENATGSPSIAFSAFDPVSERYVDLSIPSLPVKVKPGVAGRDIQALVRSDRLVSKPEEQLTLSALAATPGKSMRHLYPFQQRGWFLPLQAGPLIVLVALWKWDARRRYFEQHPGELLRLKARRALRKERRALRKASREGDAAAYADRAISAMRVACAPHYPAEPRALVGSEIIEVLGENGNQKIVREVFNLADSAKYNTPQPAPESLLSRQPEIERALEELEAKL